MSDAETARKCFDIDVLAIPNDVRVGDVATANVAHALAAARESGARAALEAAAKICDERAGSHVSDAAYWVRGVARHIRALDAAKIAGGSE